MKRAEEFFVRHERLFEGLFVLACFLFYFAWAAVKWENYGPDENMRLMIPRFILKHGALPTGWEGEVLQGSWGISYGFKPTQLPALCSALFMKIASLFGGFGDTLVVAARMTSVLAGAGGIFVLFRAMGRLFSRPVKWFLVILTASLPQYAFLSSYVNNDIVAVFGTFLVLWAWILAAKEGWRAKTVILLAIGIGVVGLSSRFLPCGGDPSAVVSSESVFARRPSGGRGDGSLYGAAGRSGIYGFSSCNADGRGAFPLGNAFEEPFFLAEEHAAELLRMLRLYGVLSAASVLFLLLSGFRRWAGLVSRFSGRSHQGTDVRAGFCRGLPMESRNAVFFCLCQCLHHSGLICLVCLRK